MPRHVLKLLARIASVYLGRVRALRNAKDEKADTAVCLPWALLRQQRVAEEVTASVGFRSLQNFRRHIVKGAQDRTLLRERRPAEVSEARFIVGVEGVSGPMARARPPTFLVLPVRSPSALHPLWSA